MTGHSQEEDYRAFMVDPETIWLGCPYHHEAPGKDGMLKHGDLPSKNEYVMQMRGTLGQIGLPTSCQFFHVWKDMHTKCKYDVNAYFIHRALGVAHPLKHMDGVTFLGYAYTHCTSFCYLTSTGEARRKVIVSNDSDDIFFMVAWGNSEGKAEYNSATGRA